ncbi:MAG TPA: hypothetical protein DE045_08820 [Oceanospirillaceae bacterium]|nr:hypothetical protein [Oceanospirillaceae bacterium]
MTNTTTHNQPCHYHVVVVGTVRNVARTLPTEVKRLHNILNSSGHIDTVQWLLIESDSTDNTIQTLDQLSKDISNFGYLGLGNLDKQIPERTERIAHCRNAYLEEIDTNPQYQETDLVIMADLDGINNILTTTALDSCFNNTDWDVCCANTQGPYYDIWALRHPQWCPVDCLQEHQFLRQHGWRSYAARFSAIYSRMITIPAESGWIEVDSAFAGLAIYKKQAINGQRYSAYAGETAICEHVNFHKGIKKNGNKIFINPALLNCSNPPHSRKLRLPHSWKLRLGLFLGAVAKQK